MVQLRTGGWEERRQEQRVPWSQTQPVTAATAQCPSSVLPPAVGSIASTYFVQATGKGQQASQSIGTGAYLGEDNGPPEASLLRRAASYADCRHARKAGNEDGRRTKKANRKNRNWEALILDTEANKLPISFEGVQQTSDVYSEQLLEASQQEYL